MVDPRDRGLAYGDGLFETLRVTAAGQVPLWDRHRQRLLNGARALGIPVPSAVRLEQQLAQGVAELGGQPGVVKLILTRGVGGRGYLPPPRAAVKPSLLVQSSPLPRWSSKHKQRGIELGLCDTPLYPDPYAGHKHLNRLAQVQARQQVAEQGWDEGLLLSPHRQPLEATAMNLFARFGDAWWTPDLAAARAGVAGVMRDWLLEHCRSRSEKVLVDLRPLSQLRRADSLFVCNSVVGVLPVRKLAQWQWPVSPEVLRLQHTADTLLCG